VPGTKRGIAKHDFEEKGAWHLFFFWFCWDVCSVSVEAVSMVGNGVELWAMGFMRW